MKLKVSLAELRRLAELLTAHAGTADFGLRDKVCHELRRHTERQTFLQQRQRAMKEDAAIAFRATFQRANRKGV